MKVIKKITAIMLSIMMVLGMSSVVSAAETSGTSTTTGSITINNAAPGETYNIYRILDLESYSGSGETENYAYKLRSDNATGSTKSWSEFIKSTAIKDVYVTIDGDYVTWKNGVATTEAKAAEFAKLALKYAKDNTTEIVADETVIAPSGATTSTVSFSGLPLGYYLVETSVGTVLALDTTKPDATIKEKNGVPSVEKKIVEGTDLKDRNTASIGDKVEFQTTITAKAGAQNYVLHDKMDKGLTFDPDSLKVQLKKKADANANDVASRNNYEKKTTGLETTDPCTFHVEFTQTFCNTLANDDQIIVTYSATLNEEAEIGSTTGNKNTTYLKYGNKSETVKKTTTTYTYEIPVFKYTLNTDGTTKKGLGGATFKLTKDNETAPSIELIKTSTATEKDTYRVAKSGKTGTVKTITTSSTGDDKGKFTIQGLDAGTYYLTETKQPDGYNKLSKAVKIVIDENGKITIDDKPEEVTLVEVENKSGSLLPSTGGRGTTLFYILGAILVVGSGVVLITKKRMK